MGFQQVVVKDIRFTLQTRYSNHTNIETQARLLGRNGKKIVFCNVVRFLESICEDGGK